ncbi:hypothetical protein DL766_002865 [Monosporascus sp. MC13-8B]|uniref:Beta-ketoacyl synthase C-terminal domain-containing protein n=1 Tax=Monosporascus cannonballus TaxID=155416 RepID=A0ABY0HD41_9PEZI|nr:hypothetical protein DL762_002549 [Monosporascus cannonballus]RYO95194.1 hypothetical protein DL763_003762 [Monosporascus cannonballus]RYP34674.1 hypothetical protein DL766_002865 [Monosporascus sp. MC13-8B]
MGNIGHAGAASGGANLAKLLLMMAHGKVPPQAGLKVLNLKIAAIKSDSTVIPRKLLDWPQWKGMPRGALLNNFGADASNAYLMLEEYAGRRMKPSNECHRGGNSSYMFVLSAKDDLAIERFRELVLKDPHQRRCAYAALSKLVPRRTVLDSRLVVKTTSTEQLFLSLANAPIAHARSRQGIVFVFSAKGLRVSAWRASSLRLGHSSERA